jgi:hypothetical protein
MRLRAVGLVLTELAALGTVAASTTIAASASRSVTFPVTQSVVIRPVTSAGRPASGFHVKTPHPEPIDCSTATSSPSAVNRNIDWCAPEAADAIACWKAATAHHALCMVDPRSHRLYQRRMTGSFAKTAAVKSSSRGPLLIALADGARCAIIDGGAWGELKSHPNWAPDYSCGQHGIIWAPEHTKHNGINESHVSWTVRVEAAANGRLIIRHIKRAYFVGTASG